MLSPCSQTSTSFLFWSCRTRLMHDLLIFKVNELLTVLMFLSENLSSWGCCHTHPAPHLLLGMLLSWLDVGFFSLSTTRWGSVWKFGYSACSPGFPVTGNTDVSILVLWRLLSQDAFRAWPAVLPQCSLVPYRSQTPEPAPVLLTAGNHWPSSPLPRLAVFPSLPSPHPTMSPGSSMSSSSCAHRLGLCATMQGRPQIRKAKDEWIHWKWGKECTRATEEEMPGQSPHEGPSLPQPQECQEQGRGRFMTSLANVGWRSGEWTSMLEDTHTARGTRPECPPGRAAWQWPGRLRTAVSPTTQLALSLECTREKPGTVHQETCEQVPLQIFRNAQSTWD